MAEEIFHLWANKVPKYDAELKSLFETHANYGGGDEARAIARGKEFEVAYEMYIYCFFQALPIPGGSQAFYMAVCRKHAIEATIEVRTMLRRKKEEGRDMTE